MGHRSAKNNNDDGNDDERWATHTTICDFSTAGLTDSWIPINYVAVRFWSVMEGHRITKEQKHSKRVQLSNPRS